MSFKVTEEQARQVRRFARLKHKTVSDYLRASALPAAAPRPPKLILKRHPLSGGWYNAAPGQASPSLEEIDEILADFP